MSADLRKRFRAVVLATSSGALLALSGAGAAGAASNSLTIKVTKRTIAITGSAAARGEVVQINYDPRLCAAYAAESQRNTPFSDFHPKRAGTFRYRISRAGLHLRSHPRYACVYLLSRQHGSLTAIESSGAVI